MSEKRSFYFCHYSPPDKTAADYSEAEKIQFKKNFEPTAKNYRRFSKIVTAMFLSVGILFLILFILGSNKILPGRYVGWLFIPWGFLLLISIVIALVLAIRFDPVCPACKRGVDRTFKIFCPECGSSQLLSGSFFKSPRCNSCGKVFGRGKSRRYKIKFCTHCGISLDDKGI
jgi:hypothetical protein